MMIFKNFWNYVNFFLTLGILGVLGFKWQGLHMKSMKATTDDGKDGKCSGVALSRFYFSGHESHQPMENHLHWKVGCKVFSMLFLLINLIKPMSKTYFFPWITLVSWWHLIFVFPFFSVFGMAKRAHRKTWEKHSTCLWTSSCSRGMRSCVCPRNLCWCPLRHCHRRDRRMVDSTVVSTV